MSCTKFYCNASSFFTIVDRNWSHVLLVNWICLLNIELIKLWKISYLNRIRLLELTQTYALRALCAPPAKLRSHAGRYLDVSSKDEWQSARIAQVHGISHRHDRLFSLMMTVLKMKLNVPASPEYWSLQIHYRSTELQNKHVRSSINDNCNILMYFVKNQMTVWTGNLKLFCILLKLSCMRSEANSP